MQSPYSHDTSTQAMTEVALGLSMAFFALLIVALLSFQMPKAKSENRLNEPRSEKIKLSQANSAQATNTESESQFVFYYQGRWFDQNLKSVALANLSKDKAVVMAVEKNVSFLDVMQLKQQINHPNLSITLLTPEWIVLLEQQ